MIVLDTHAWVWWVNQSRQLSEAAAAAIASADVVGVSAVSCWEVARLALEDRIELDRDPTEWIRRALALPAVTSVPLEALDGVEAARLDRDAFPRDPADRFIYATAKRRAAILVTRDRRLREFDPRGTLW